MDEPFNLVMGKEFDLEVEDDVYIWNNAWDIARDKEFKV